VFPEVLYSRYVKRNGDVAGDIAFFDFGTCVFWNLTPAQERSILDASLHPYEEGKLSSAKVESDVFQFRLLPYAKPAIQVRRRVAHRPAARAAAAWAVQPPGASVCHAVLVPPCRRPRPPRRTTSSP
jgi:hypothetical protein